MCKIILAAMFAAFVYLGFFKEKNSDQLQDLNNSTVPSIKLKYNTLREQIKTFNAISAWLKNNSLSLKPDQLSSIQNNRKDLTPLIQEMIKKTFGEISIKHPRVKKRLESFHEFPHLPVHNNQVKHHLIKNNYDKKNTKSNTKHQQRIESNKTEGQPLIQEVIKNNLDELIRKFSQAEIYSNVNKHGTKDPGRKLSRQSNETKQQLLIQDLIKKNSDLITDKLQMLDKNITEIPQNYIESPVESLPKQKQPIKNEEFDDRTISTLWSLEPSLHSEKDEKAKKSRTNYPSFAELVTQKLQVIQNNITENDTESKQKIKSFPSALVQLPEPRQLIRNKKSDNKPKSSLWPLIPSPFTEKYEKSKENQTNSIENEESNNWPFRTNQNTEKNEKSKQNQANPQLFAELIAEKLQQLQNYPESSQKIELLPPDIRQLIKNEEPGNKTIPTVWSLEPNENTQKDENFKQNRTNHVAELTSRLLSQEKINSDNLTKLTEQTEWPTSSAENAVANMMDQELNTSAQMQNLIQQLETRLQSKFDNQFQNIEKQISKLVEEEQNLKKHIDHLQVQMDVNKTNDDLRSPMYDTKNKVWQYLDSHQQLDRDKSVNYEGIIDYEFKTDY